MAKKVTTDNKKVVPKKIKIYIIAADSAVATPYYLYRTTPLKKIMYAYCYQMGRRNLDGLRFRFDGEPILPSDTPISKGIDNEEEIEVFEQSIGGCGLFKNV